MTKSHILPLNLVAKKNQASRADEALSAETATEITSDSAAKPDMPDAHQQAETTANVVVESRVSVNDLNAQITALEQALEAEKQAFEQYKLSVSKQEQATLASKDEAEQLKTALNELFKQFSQQSQAALNSQHDTLVSLLAMAMQHLIRYELLEKSAIAKLTRKIILEHQTQEAFSVHLGERIYKVVQEDSECTDILKLCKLDERLAEYEFEVKKAMGYLSVNIQDYIKELMMVLAQVTGAEHG